MNFQIIRDFEIDKNVMRREWTENSPRKLLNGVALGCYIRFKSVSLIKIPDNADSFKVSGSDLDQWKQTHE